VLQALSEAGAGEIPVVVGGSSEADEASLREAGIAAVYTPKDWDLNQMMRDIIALVAQRNGIGAAPPLTVPATDGEQLARRLRERDLSVARGDEPWPRADRRGPPSRQSGSGRPLPGRARRRGPGH